MPMRRICIPKRGNSTEKRPLGILAIRDSVCQQALKNRLEPMFEPSFNGCSYGYRPGRSPHDALRKIWNELMQGYCWVVDADLRYYFGSVTQEKLINLVAEKVSDGRVLTLIRQMLKSDYVESSKYFPPHRVRPRVV